MSWTIAATLGAVAFVAVRRLRRTERECAGLNRLMDHMRADLRAVEAQRDREFNERRRWERAYAARLPETVT